MISLTLSLPSTLIPFYLSIAHSGSFPYPAYPNCPRSLSLLLPLSLSTFSLPLSFYPSLPPSLLLSLLHLYLLLLSLLLSLKLLSFSLSRSLALTTSIPKVLTQHNLALSISLVPFSLSLSSYLSLFGFFSLFLNQHPQTACTYPINPLYLALTQHTQSAHPPYPLYIPLLQSILSPSLSTLPYLLL
jgi:hypothetical protein